MLIWIGFGFRLFNIQIINKLNSPQGIKLESINGFRGNFYDANGNNLTQNLTFYRIGIHPQKILKPLIPSKEEVSINNRARSAKMRVGEKIA